ncbi:hypothetical protein B7P43_G07315 [Cryptotermes secundus]|uniref:Uncharacterized protein n=1 Tax=Cryptotermes secundus TaxID=105785 RepID=A0A2J7RMX2_9NEOP|nr:hypothetical protein B7P43_G07315 [Cryptotermes secundus]
MLEEFGPPAVHRDTIVRINKQFDETASALNPKHPVLSDMKLTPYHPRLIHVLNEDDLERLARSPDITPPDFFLWGYLKEKVYANPIDSVKHLREVIFQEFNKVPVNMCRKACENVALRLQACADLGGAQVDQHLENR